MTAILKARKAADGLPQVVVRPSVPHVRLLWGLVLLAMFLGLVAALDDPSFDVFRAVAVVFMPAVAYSIGVSRLEVDEAGVRRRDSLGRLQDWDWQQVRAVEMRDFDRRRLLITQGAMTLVDRDGAKLPVVAAVWPDELKVARKAVAVRAEARGVTLLDNRAHAQPTDPTADMP